MAEMEIPFSTLRFSPDQEAWGMNIRRLVRRVRRLQDRRDALVRRAGRRHHGAHEPDDDYRKNQDREVAVERGEIAEAHRAQNDEPSAHRQDDQRREIGRKHDHGDQAGKQPQDTETDVARPCVRRSIGPCLGSLCVASRGPRRLSHARRGRRPCCASCRRARGAGVGRARRLCAALAALSGLPRRARAARAEKGFRTDT